MYRAKRGVTQLSSPVWKQTHIFFYCIIIIIYNLYSWKHFFNLVIFLIFYIFFPLPELLQIVMYWPQLWWVFCPYQGLFGWRPPCCEAPWIQTELQLQRPRWHSGGPDLPKDGGKKKWYDFKNTKLLKWFNHVLFVKTQGSPLKTVKRERKKSANRDAYNLQKFWKKKVSFNFSC